MKGEFIMRQLFSAIGSLLQFIPAVLWVAVWAMLDPVEDKEARDKIINKI